MTKEELKKEAEEYALNQWEGNLPWSVIQKSYYDGALPREKQIQIDAEQIRALQKQNGELTDENERLKGDLELWESGACRATNLDKCGVVKELKAQIEKMKCCYNCSKWNDGQCADIPNSSYYSADFVCEDWEMKENE